MGIPKRGLMACANCGAVQGEKERLESERDQARKELEECRKWLEKAMWVDDGDSFSICVECGAIKPDHIRPCDLEAFLSRPAPSMKQDETKEDEI